MMKDGDREHKEFDELEKRDSNFFDVKSIDSLRYYNRHRNLRTTLDLHCQKKVEALYLIQVCLENDPYVFTFITGKGKRLKGGRYEFKLFNFVYNILKSMEEEMDFLVEKNYERGQLKIRSF